MKERKIEWVGYWSTVFLYQGKECYLTDNDKSEKSGYEFVFAKRCKPGQKRNPRGKFIAIPWGTVVQIVTESN